MHLHPNNQIFYITFYNLIQNMTTGNTLSSNVLYFLKRDLQKEDAHKFSNNSRKCFEKVQEGLRDGSCSLGCRSEDDRTEEHT